MYNDNACISLNTINICYQENTAITLSKIKIILSWVGILDYFSCYHLLLKKCLKRKDKKCEAGLMTSCDHIWSCSSGDTSMDLSYMRWEETGGGRRAKGGGLFLPCNMGRLGHLCRHYVQPVPQSHCLSLSKLWVHFRTKVFILIL